MVPHGVKAYYPHHPNYKNHQGTKRDDREVVGRVTRFMGQQRVAIYLEGLLTMTTAYVPNDFLEPFDAPAAGLQQQPIKHINDLKE